MKDMEFFESLNNEEMDMVKKFIADRRQSEQKKKEIMETFEGIRSLIFKLESLGEKLYIDLKADCDTYYQQEINADDLYY